MSTLAHCFNYRSINFEVYRFRWIFFRWKNSQHSSSFVPPEGWPYSCDQKLVQQDFESMVRTQNQQFCLQTKASIPQILQETYCLHTQTYIDLKGAFSWPRCFGPFDSLWSFVFFLTLIIFSRKRVGFPAELSWDKQLQIQVSERLHDEL